MRTILIAAALVGGLTTTAQGEPATKADKGFILDHFRSFLADPYDLRSTGISDVVPLKGYGGRDIPAGICVQFNGKNQYGAYAGINRLVYVRTASGLAYGDAKFGVSTSTCEVEGVTYKPFPELGKIR